VNLGRRGGIRDAFRLVPAIRELATTAPLWRLATKVLGPDCAAVRAIIFDKTPGANWKVSWHQDLTIAVQRRVDAPGFGPWSVKAGIVHVQPPATVLERMVALRLHLDACMEDNGPVRVLPGSHKAGRLREEDIARWRAERKPVSCLARRGDVLAMRPLLLHSSSPAQSPVHRRVVHIEYAGVALGKGLVWFEAWRPPETAAGAAWQTHAARVVPIQ
jgi:ectoine hydroxylase-related dioxygenase (phytanoyl-CoA dioxygenase family)